MLKILAVLFAARQRGVEDGAAAPTVVSHTPVAVDELCEATSGRAAAVIRVKIKRSRASSLLQ